MSEERETCLGCDGTGYQKRYRIVRNHEREEDIAFRREWWDETCGRCEGHGYLIGGLTVKVAAKQRAKQRVGEKVQGVGR